METGKANLSMCKRLTKRFLFCYSLVTEKGISLAEGNQILVDLPFRCCSYIRCLSLLPPSKGEYIIFGPLVTYALYYVLKK